VEKTNLTTTDVAKRLAQASGLRERDIGYAGMKDKVAVTRQWFSLCTKDETAATWDLGAGARILEATRHGNKLRTGHLIANRFRITLVDVPAGGVERATPILAQLKERGLPNYFGPQRFGYAGRNLEKSLHWLRSLSQEGPPADREDAPDRGRRSRKKGRKNDRFQNKLLPSVIQSEIFNRYLSARLVRPEELLLGEVVRLDQTGTSFVVEDVEKELVRFRAGDLHLSGPMIGPKGLHAQADAKKLEEEVVASLELSDASLEQLGQHAPGTRRDLFLYPEGLEVEAKGEHEFVLSFALPAGAYATQLLREFSGSAWESPRESASELT
jgi:tRNA pseudouridine13 synthase